MLSTYVASCLFSRSSPRVLLSLVRSFQTRESKLIFSLFVFARLSACLHRPLAHRKERQMPRLLEGRRSRVEEGKRKRREEKDEGFVEIELSLSSLARFLLPSRLQVYSSIILSAYHTRCISFVHSSLHRSFRRRAFLRSVRTVEFGVPEGDEMKVEEE